MSVSLKGLMEASRKQWLFSNVLKRGTFVTTSGRSRSLGSGKLSLRVEQHWERKYPYFKQMSYSNF